MMSEDTKRALDLIRPIAKELHIEISADRNFLYLNDMAIGISCNSTYATLMEFIGYVFVRYFAKDRGVRFTPAVREKITRYWFDQDKLRIFKAIAEGTK